MLLYRDRTSLNLQRQNTKNIERQNTIEPADAHEEDEIKRTENKYRNSKGESGIGIGPSYAVCDVIIIHVQRILHLFLGRIYAGIGHTLLL